MLSYDIAIIGAGPAGIGAALTAASCGLKAVVLDEQPRPGGQIYRNVTGAPRSVSAVLGPDYLYGETLVRTLIESAVEHRFATLVWDVARDLTISAQQQGRSFRLKARQVISATGAIERPSPMPGWTLPGVLTAGAAQIALKTAGSLPAGRVVLAGGGPLLLLVACQLLDAGAQVTGIVDTTPVENRWGALKHFPSAVGAPAYLLKGLRMLQRLRRSSVPTFSRARNLELSGSEHVTGLQFAHAGAMRQIEADVVLLHHGIVPNTQLSRLLRVDHDWDPIQSAWCPRVDAWHETSHPGFRIAGDGASIVGARAAEATGILAALGAARALGRLSQDEAERRAAPVRRMLTQHLRVRPFLNALYRPPDWILDPADDTVICRCEEITAGRVREVVRLGCKGPNQVKFFTRCGMGPCQGRLCGLTVTQILSAALQIEPEEIGAYRVRPPLKPISLTSLAALADEDADGNCEEQRHLTKPH